LLAELNGMLSVCQDKVNQKYTRTRFPVVLIMGLPRSGTTLFFQWLAESKHWGYPSNIVSRFYGAPYIGARVQQILLENDYKNEITGFQKTDPYFSSLGKTKGAAAPHEFWYFWRRFFPLCEDADIVSPETLEKVDTARLNAELATLEAALEKPLAMKAMLLNWHIPFLDKAFEKVLFVHVKRDPIYVMQSILEGRQKNFGSIEQWYAFKPPESVRAVMLFVAICGRNATASSTVPYPLTRGRASGAEKTFDPINSDVPNPELNAMWPTERSAAAGFVGSISKRKLSVWSVATPGAKMRLLPTSPRPPA